MNVQTTDLPVLIDIVRKTLPEGVRLSIHEHNNEHSEARYGILCFKYNLKCKFSKKLEKRKSDLCKYEFYSRYIPDPFIDGLRTELHELHSKKQSEIDKAIAEKAAKGKLK